MKIDRWIRASLPSTGGEYCVTCGEGGLEDCAWSRDRSVFASRPRINRLSETYNFKIGAARGFPTRVALLRSPCGRAHWEISLFKRDGCVCVWQLAGLSWEIRGTGIRAVSHRSWCRRKHSREECYGGRERRRLQKKSRHASTKQT